jgi:hypothetical protein
MLIRGVLSTLPGAFPVYALSVELLAGSGFLKRGRGRLAGYARKIVERPPVLQVVGERLERDTGSTEDRLPA